MGSLPAEIRRTGRLTLTNDGRIEAHHDNGQKIGEIVVGIDGVYFDGFEPIFCQRNDPSKLRLASRYDNDGDGLNGVISYNRLRSDDRMEERVMLQGGPVEDGRKGEMGQYRVAIRCSNDQQDWQTAFIATTHRLGRLWTGLCNSMGWLWKFANQGDQPPLYVENPNKIQRMWSVDGMHFTQQQDDGNFVTYHVDQAFNMSANPRAVWSAWTGKIEPA